jgi:ribosome-associated toxin RatA of RatAB toxin-antitoxin module
MRGPLLAAVAFALWAPAPPAAAHPDRVSGAVVLDASPDLVWQVLTDFEHWPGFVPGLLRLRVVPQEGAGFALRHETVRLGYRIDFTARTHVDAQARRLELSLDEDASNDLAAMEASWQVTEIPGGRVRVSFHSTLDSGQPVPRFLERHLLRESVARTVEGFQREVARRAGERRAAADATGSDG